MLRYFFIAGLVGLMSTACMAATFSYGCFSVHNGDQKQDRRVIVLNTRALTLTTVDHDGQRVTGRLDRLYHPRTRLDRVAYKGFSNLLSDEDGRNTVLVSKVLLNGGARLRDGSVGGFIEITCRGEGYFSTVELCRRLRRR